MMSLREYLYKSEMSPEEWAAIKAEYGPTDDLPMQVGIPRWNCF